MTKRQLYEKLDCKRCGTIQMDIPADVIDTTVIHCSNCGAYLGTGVSYRTISKSRSKTRPYSI